MTNQIVSAVKIDRLCAVAASRPADGSGSGSNRGSNRGSGITVGVLVDDEANVPALATAAARHGVTLHVYVERDAGQARCGCESDEEVVAVARAVARAGDVGSTGVPPLVFGGLHCYHGGIQHVDEEAERRRAVMDGPVARARSAVRALEEAGLTVDCVTGGGTGTYPYEIEGGVHGELQCGSYLLMDGQYNGALSGGGGGDAVSVDTRVEGGDGRPGRGEGTGHGAFQSALFVHATVMSAKGDKRVIDAGSKAIDLLGGFPIAVAPVWGGPLRGTDAGGGSTHGQCWRRY